MLLAIIIFELVFGFRCLLGVLDAVSARARWGHAIIGASAIVASVVATLQRVQVGPVSGVQWVDGGRVSQTALWMVAYGISVSAGALYYAFSAMLGGGACALLYFASMVAMEPQRSELFVAGLMCGLLFVPHLDFLHPSQIFEVPMSLFKFCMTCNLALYIFGHFQSGWPVMVADLQEALDFIAVCGCGHLLCKRYSRKPGPSYGSTSQASSSETSPVLGEA